MQHAKVQLAKQSHGGPAVGCACWVLVVVLFGGLACARRPSASAARESDPTTLDGDKWTRRNIQLLRWALNRPNPDDMSSRDAAYGFSLQFNPLLWRDPHAPAVANLVEAYQKKAGEKAKAYDQTLAVLRMPQPQRLRHLPPERPDVDDDERPTSRPKRPPGPWEIADRIMELPPDARAAQEPELLAQMESAARERKEWGRLALAYFQLAGRARTGREPQKAGPYIDRMLEVLREHPVFQEPNRGNTDAVEPLAVARQLLEVRRRNDLEGLIEAHAGEARADLAVGLVGALAEKGDFDAAKAALEEYLRPVGPEAAERLAAALDGKVVLPPPAPDKRRREVPPAEGRLRMAQAAVARGFAARGDVDTAGNMLARLGRDDSPMFLRAAGRDEGEGIASYEWSRLAMAAASAGHAAAASRAFERAIEAAGRDRIAEPHELEETARLVREAVAVRDHRTADRMLNTSSAPGAWARLQLAKTYRRQGNVAKARATLDEALKRAYAEEHDGPAMAGIAVELHALGDGKRAQKVLLDAFDRIEGVDFGFGGTADIVSAAVRMKRTDLLDRLYEQRKPGERLLLCIVASRMAAYGPGEKED